MSHSGCPLGLDPSKENRVPQYNSANCSCCNQCGCGCNDGGGGEDDGAGNSGLSATKGPSVISERASAGNMSDNESDISVRSAASSDRAEPARAHVYCPPAQATRVDTDFIGFFNDENGFRHIPGQMTNEDIRRLLFYRDGNIQNGTPDSLVNEATRTPRRTTTPSSSIKSYRIGSPALQGTGTWQHEILPGCFVKSPLRLTPDEKMREGAVRAPLCSTCRTDYFKESPAALSDSELGL